MGLIKAGLNSVSGVFADQWKEFFYCDAIDDDTLVVKGQKRIGAKSSNTKGNDNIISNGSGISVADGQCMIIVEQGKVVEVCAEPGEFIWDSSTEPSIFTGNLGEAVKNTFSTIGKRFTYGGDTGKDQRVYYFNTKEIMDNKFGTSNPIMFRVVNKSISLDRTVNLRCNGTFTFRITDPLMFYTKVCGNVEYSYDKSEIYEQLRTEFVSGLQPAFGKLSMLQLHPAEIPAHQFELEEAMREVLSEKWTLTRGLTVVSIALNPITLSEEDMKKIQVIEDAATFGNNPNMMAGRMGDAAAAAYGAAASNPNGAMMGFMGLNMASGGMANPANLQGLYQQSNTNTAQQNNGNAQINTWKCACGADNTGKFCTNCGKPKQQGWICKCGTENTGKFCMNCGSQKPDDVASFKCNKCGWIPDDPKNPPKFCPECGDIFNSDDKI